MSILSKGHRELVRILDEKFAGNQSEMARSIDVAPSTVSRWVTSLRKPDLEDAVMLHKKLGIDPGTWGE